MTRFVVALKAEARPLIEKYGLAPDDRSPVRTYRGDGKSLAVSGVGKAAAAAATSAMSEGDTETGVWLNVGIAGHRDFAVGDLVRIHRITDRATGARFYPTLIGLSHIESAGLTTVDAPETTFASNDVYDMEASGFYETALRASTSELVQCVKIVSDNLESGTDGLTGHRVSELVERNIDTIDAIVSHLEALGEERAPLHRRPDAEPFFETWHFTTSERRRLTKLLHRCQVFRASATVDEFRRSSSASAVLHAIDERLRALAKEQSEL